ncbi:hypothetical protein B0H14DRAFT_3136098 [Mycena olivaceomarginata]|nr:hypothetical protein B0H14DRAFT_3136098 [Mycena olivaceomarginata]
MSTTENTGHHTRGATAADSVSVAEDGHNVSYPLATVPSTVVTGGPVLVERGSPGVSDAGHSRSEFLLSKGMRTLGPQGPKEVRKARAGPPLLMSREELETLARRYGSMAMYGRRHGSG